MSSDAVMRRGCRRRERSPNTESGSGLWPLPTGEWGRLAPEKGRKTLRRPGRVMDEDARVRHTVALCSGRPVRFSRRDATAECGCVPRTGLERPVYRRTPLCGDSRAVPSARCDGRQAIHGLYLARGCGTRRFATRERHAHHIPRRLEGKAGVPMAPGPRQLAKLRLKPTGECHSEPRLLLGHRWQKLRQGILLRRMGRGEREHPEVWKTDPDLGTLTHLSSSWRLETTSPHSHGRRYCSHLRV
jgi:hypothetical protein